MSVVKCLVLVLCVIVVLTPVENARILCLFPIPFVSHQNVHQNIWRELSLRGHQVTVVTPKPLNDPTLTNLTEIDLSFAFETMDSFQFQNVIHKNMPMFKTLRTIFKILLEVTHEELRHPKVLELINDKTLHFDVVLVEFWQPVFYAFQARFNCPMIGVSSLGTTTVGHDSVGNPTHPVLFPDIILPMMKTELGFIDRILSTAFEMFYRLLWKYFILPENDAIARKYFGNDIPFLGDIEKNVSLLFLNTNPILHPNRPNVPAVIELGNMHIKSLKPLPDDLKKEMDSAVNGTVYFSLGSNIKSASLIEEQREIIIEALSLLPYKVFWKWETDQIPKLPKNVIVRKWFPQRDLLAHPKVKVFVTQGGLQSLEESIASEVPVVVVPIFGDQPLNAAKIVNLGIGLSADIFETTPRQLADTILEVAQNEKYKKTMTKIAAISSDVPMKGLEKVVWWTEYVIRHKGARHLRSPAVDTPWYRYYLIDVIALATVCAWITFYVISKSLCFVYNVMHSNKKNVNKMKLN